MLETEPYLIDNSKSGEYDSECDVECNDNFDLKAGTSNNICQLDGNASVEESLDGYDTDDDINSEPIRAVLVPAQSQAGQPFSLEVGSDRVQAPSSLPLAMIANFRSAYNKAKNIKRNLTTLGLDLMIASESWERPNFPLPDLLDSPHYSILSYCRGRETPAVRQDGRHAGKLYPAKTGGGAAIIYNKHRFKAIETDIGVPAGIEAVWTVLAPCRLDSQLQRVQRICVGAVYIAPRSPYKEETIDHIIHTIQVIRAKYNNEVHFLVAGDFNRVSVREVLHSYGALQQMCGVPTRKGATLELVLTDLHTYMEPPTLQPALQVDEGAKGKDSDHQAIILAPKASGLFVVQREKRRVKTRPMPQSKVDLFCAELTKHRWGDVLDAEDVNIKVNLYHKYQRDLLDKKFPEKTVMISNLDKAWMTPELKQILRQVQRERLQNGKSVKFKQLWAKFCRLKRRQIKTFHKKFVQDLKVTSPGKWYMMMKKLGGLDQMNTEKIEVKSLRGLSDKESAAAVAQSFAAVSQEYSPLDREQLPAFLPAGRPEQVGVFQVLDRIKKLGKTKSTLPIDLPDKLRIECALDLAEPLTDIINSCLRTGQFPAAWRREWVTPVPKAKRMEDLETCKDLRKIASTSDSAKIFESFLRDWITKDIGDKIYINQFAGKTGVGTEHMIVWMMDRVLKLLDQPGMSASVSASVDWSDAFSRTDPTKTVQKLIWMGLRPSIIPIIIEFLEDRLMSLKFNGEESPLFHLIGGGPQGSWNGQNCYLTASNDNTDFVQQEDRFKYCDDVNILELIMIGAILTHYNFHDHVASDIGIDQSFLPLSESVTQQNLTQISDWTTNNLMQLNKNKTNYLVFTRSRQDFATRLTLDGQILEICH